MDVSAEAKRVMVQALSKMYSSRSQRGGLRLHRSLLLTLVMKSARDIYHSARAACERPESPESPELRGEAAEPPSDPPQPEPPLLEKPESPHHQQEELQAEDASMEVSSPDLDRENRSPTRADRHSRKRRGKTATEPDFLPCKRAKMDSGEVVLRILQDASLRSNAGGSCARGTDTLPSSNTHTHIPRTVATC